MIFNRKLILVIFLSFFLFQNNFCDNFYDEEYLIYSEEISTRSIFYNVLLEIYGLKDRIKINKDKNDLYIETNSDFNKGEAVFGIDKRYFFTSCDYYPFKEFLLNSITEIIKPSGNHYLELIPSFNLAFNILYFKFGDRNKARKYYGDILSVEYRIDKTYRYFRFEIDQQVKEYLNYIPEKSGTINAFKFHEDDINLTKRFGLSMSFYNNMNIIYDSLIERINHTETAVKVILNILFLLLTGGYFIIFR
jgi:hypothetical protein